VRANIEWELKGFASYKGLEAMEVCELSPYESYDWMRAIAW